jgi:hypothetical protein
MSAAEKCVLSYSMNKTLHVHCLTVFAMETYLGRLFRTQNAKPIGRQTSLINVRKRAVTPGYNKDGAKCARAHTCLVATSARAGNIWSSVRAGVRAPLELRKSSVGASLEFF